MPNKRNYQRELEKLIEAQAGRVPGLLLHACCAPCSSYVLEYLSQYFQITIYYYNPNIDPPEEYEKRLAEEERLIGEMEANGVFAHPVSLIKAPYDCREFYEAVKGLEDVPEGGERCSACFRLRLDAAGREAKKGGYDYFSTTLTLSPLKNAQKINGIGEEIAEKYGIRWLPSDFKKRDGYNRSIELSAAYGLYRQNYCGCVFSKREREAKEEKI